MPNSIKYTTWNLTIPYMPPNQLYLPNRPHTLRIHPSLSLPPSKGWVNNQISQAKGQVGNLTSPRPGAQVSYTPPKSGKELWILEEKQAPRPNKIQLIPPNQINSSHFLSIYLSTHNQEGKRFFKGRRRSTKGRGLRVPEVHDKYRQNPILRTEEIQWSTPDGHKVRKGVYNWLTQEDLRPNRQ